MLSFPNAKINLGLNVIARRPDGFHDIQSCFFPIPLCDVLEIIPSAKFMFTSSGLEIPGDQERNLCVLAYRLLSKRFDLKPVHMHLHKCIPTGAGLGGGSADSAFALTMLNEIFELDLTNEALEETAAQLGSDCPFFIRNQPVYATGTGTHFSALNVDLSGKFLALKHPPIHIDTKRAYQQLKPQVPQRPIPEIVNLPISEWNQWLKNDFENVAFAKYPAIGHLKEELYRKGALYASMTGSGSAVYGLFENKPDMEDWMVFTLGG